MEMVEQWFQDKYKIPSNHELFQSRTAFDLLVEFYQDYFRKNPIEAYKSEDGSVTFTNTGDSMIDEWEKQLAAGQTPDLSEVFPDGALDKIKQAGKKFREDRHGQQGMSFGDVQKVMERKLEKLGPPDKPRYNKPTFGNLDG